MAFRRFRFSQRGAGPRGSVERLRRIRAARLGTQQGLEGLGRGPRLPGGEEALPAQAQQLAFRHRGRLLRQRDARVLGRIRKSLLRVGARGPLIQR